MISAFFCNYCPRRNDIMIKTLLSKRKNGSKSKKLEGEFCFFWSLNYFLNIKLNLIHTLICNSTLNRRATFTASRDSLSFEICPFTPKSCILLIPQSEVRYTRPSKKTSSKTQKWKNPAMLSCLGVLLGYQMAFYSLRGHFLGEQRIKWSTSSVTKHFRRHFECRVFNLQEEFLKLVYRRQPKMFESCEYWAGARLCYLSPGLLKGGTVDVSMELTLLPWSGAKSCWTRLESKCDKRLIYCFVVIFLDIIFLDHKAGILWLLMQKDSSFELVAS